MTRHQEMWMILMKLGDVLKREIRGNFLLLLANSVNTLVFGIKILDVHRLPFFSQHIIITVNFLNHCDFHVMDTMPLLVEMPTTCLLHLFLFDIVSMFWETSLEGPFTLTNILVIAFWTSDAINDIFCLTISHKINFLNKISFWRFDNFSFTNKRTNWTIQALFHAFNFTFSLGQILLV